jgi:Holliday junction DNA helicase RuvA
MYEYISGTLVNTHINTAIIDVNGIGYKIFTTQHSQKQTSVGENAKFYTHLHVREDIFDIYGFATKEERTTFEMLLSISGVGPKAALNVLSTLTPTELALAIASEDSKAITKVNGVGSKMASRIVLELKDKITKEFETSSVKSFNITPINSTANDAVSALMVLGYSADEAGKAVDGIEAATTEEIVLKALVKL